MSSIPQEVREAEGRPSGIRDGQVSMEALRESARRRFGQDEDASPSEEDGAGEAPAQGVNQDPDSPAGTDDSSEESQRVPLERLGEVNAKRREAEGEAERLKAELRELKAKLREQQENPSFEGEETEDGYRVSRETFEAMRELKFRDYVMDEYQATREQANAIAKAWRDFDSKIDIEKAYRLAVADNPSLFGSSSREEAGPSSVPNSQRVTRPGGSVGRREAQPEQRDPKADALSRLRKAQEQGLDGHSQQLLATEAFKNDPRVREFLRNGY